MIINDQKIYDGSFIHQRFNYKYFRDKVHPQGDIVAFRAPAKVDTFLVDLEDSLSKDYIYSDDMMHFCWELPLCNNAFGAVAFQWLFCSTVGNILARYLGVNIEISGDDVIVLKEHSQGGIIQQKGKASVSITHLVDGVAIGHLGINVVCGKDAPAFAYSTNMSNDKVEAFMRSVQECFYSMVQDIWIATSKTQISK